MQKSDCYFLGKITKPHALKGEVIVWLDVDNPEDYTNMDSVFVEIKNELVPFMIEEIQIRGKKSIAKFEDINTIEATEPFIGLDLYLPTSVLPKLKGTQFYYHEIIGYTLFDQTSQKEIGEILAVYDSTGNDLFAVMVNEIEVLIPIVDDFIVELKREEKQIILRLPDGLVEVYTNP